MQPEERVLEMARESGFDLAGIAPLRPPRDAGRFEEWIDAGRHGSMEYLARNRERIVDPRRVLAEGRSLLVVGLGHSRPEAELPGGGRVARYAAGRDYHNLVGRRLRKLARRLAAEGLAGRARSIVDAGPLLERSHAAEAGLGFASKAANLLHPAFGPWFFLGELLLDVDLEPTTAPPAGSCGTCTACLDACPTAAILEPGLVDARRCISYQTIENRGHVPHDLREAHGDWVFGCDVCSEVCPWGSSAPDVSERYGRHEVLEGDLVSWIETPAEPGVFEARFGGSPLRRPRRAGLARNAAIVLGNRPSEEGQRSLLRVLATDPSASVREAAAWGLARGHGRDAGSRDAVESALAREPSSDAKCGMHESLERYS